LHFDPGDPERGDGRRNGNGNNGYNGNGNGAHPRRQTFAKLFITPRFDTAYPKYKWLTERQCAGFGLLTIDDGQIVQATFDIYSLR
jgi:hypothetical protein